MKVICINDKFELNGKTRKLQITEGEIYTASNVPRKSVYRIHEHPMYDGQPVYYEKFRFIECSPIDETEFERSYNNKELV